MKLSALQKKAIKTFVMVVSSIQWTYYAGKTFVIWEFTNPFQWIVDIPTYDQNTRCMMCVFGVFYLVIVYFFCHLYHESKSKNSNA